MTDFQTLVSTYSSLRKGSTLTLDELAEVTTLAKLDHEAHPAVWAQFRRILNDHTDLKPKDAAQEYRVCRITADLHGAYPYSVVEFIPAFLESRGYRMKFSGEFGNSTDADYIVNRMVIWSHEIVGGQPVFADSQIRAAFANWQAEEKDRLVRQAYQHVKHDPAADGGELERFARLVTAESDDTERDIRATVIGLTNFIYRVKNHLRQRWRHGIHMMPVLYGPQGSGKTTAVRHLLSPLAELSSAVGFDIFDHDAKMYALSVVPIMFFDEMAGISKAENERLKDIMHTQNRELRRLYGNPSTRTLVTTFIGCSNKDISTLIRDETGNRRYLQIATPRLVREDILKFDALAMWRSVDEDGEAPLYANAADLATVTDLQREQRHLGKVEHWLAESDCCPDRVSPSTLFKNHYIPWVRDMYPGQDKFENLRNFGVELTRLTDDKHPRLTLKWGKSSKLYTVLPRAA